MFNFLECLCGIQNFPFYVNRPNKNRENGEPKKGKRYGEAMEGNNTHTREIKLMFNIYSVVVFNNILHIQNLAFI